MILLLGVMCSGCSSTAVSTRLYVLNPVTGAMTDPVKTNAFSVGIASLTLPPHLERSQIVTRSSSNQLKLAEFDRWGGSLRKNITQVLVKNISALFKDSRISIVSDYADAALDMNIEVGVSRFEKFPDGKVYLSAMWRIVDSSGDTLETHVSEFNGPVAGNGYDSIVQTMSMLLGDLSREIAQAVTRIHSRR